MVTFIDEWRRKFPSCMIVKRLMIGQRRGGCLTLKQPWFNVWCLLRTAQQTQDSDLMPNYCWASIADVGPTLINIGSLLAVCMLYAPPPVLRSFSESGGGVWSDKRSLHVTVPLFNVGSMLALWWSWPSIQPALCQHPVRILNNIRQYLQSWRPILPPKHIVPWIWKGVSATLQNVRYILPYPWGRFFCALTAAVIFSNRIQSTFRAYDFPPPPPRKKVGQFLLSSDNFARQKNFWCIFVCMTCILINHIIFLIFLLRSSTCAFSVSRAKFSKVNLIMHFCILYSLFIWNWYWLHNCQNHDKVEKRVN